MRALTAALGLAFLTVPGACRERAEPARPPAAAPAAAEAEAASATEGVAAQRATAPAGGELPEPEQGYTARQGRALYLAYCATCHGAEGGGDGFNAFGLDPKPRDLADPLFQARRSDSDLVAIIRTGGGAAGLSTAMPPWGRTLSEREIRHLVTFVRTLGKTTS
jgi:mono/diheme cytochrome c family protein